KNWPAFASMHPEWFVLADDFAGSGGTLLKVVTERLPILLQRFPKAKVRILIAVGFKEGLQRSLDKLAYSASRVQIVPGLLFDDTDRCFTSSSRVVRKPDYRALLEEVCVAVAKDHYPEVLERGDHLGWGKMGIVVVFPETVPNNTLPIL